MLKHWFRKAAPTRQAPIHSESLDRPISVVCFLPRIVGYEDEKSRALNVVGGAVTTTLENVKIFMTVKASFIYVHSNYLQRGQYSPTKLATNCPSTLEILVGNLIGTKEDFSSAEFYQNFCHAYAAKFTYFVDQAVLLHPRWAALSFAAVRNVYIIDQDDAVLSLEQWRGANAKRTNAMTTNYVTFTLAAGASFQAPIAIGRDIQQTFQAANATQDTHLREHLEELVKQASRLIEAIPSDEAKNEVSQQLATFVEQAKKDHPSRSLLKVTSQGLLEAAATIAHMVAPVSLAVNGVLSLLGLAA